MEIRPKQPTTMGSPDIFTGDAWIDRITEGERFRVNWVRFAPGTRNAWHAHAMGQTLHVTDGIGRVQQRGHEMLEVRAGDTIYTPPGEWHWHGAAPDHFMTHLAIWEAPAEGEETQWGDKISDADYQGSVKR